MLVRPSRLPDELAALASSVAVWLFVGLPVGGAATGLASAFGVSPPLSTTGTVALVGAFSVVGLAAADRRPSAIRSALFWLTNGVASTATLLAALHLPTGLGGDRLLDGGVPVVGIVVAYPLAFRGGYGRLLGAVESRLGSARRRES